MGLVASGTSGKESIQSSPSGKSLERWERKGIDALKAKAWAVYRDDVTDLDGLAEALQKALPETCQWESETVHE